MEKDINYYLKLPYTIEFQDYTDEGWFVKVKELPGCMSQGGTAEEALEMIQDAMQGWLEVALEEGGKIPEPRSEEDYSGKFVVRVPISLHRQLVGAAEEEGVSLNQHINVTLAEAVGEKSGRPKLKIKEVERTGRFWPGLSIAAYNSLCVDNLEYEAGNADERLFAEWLGNMLAVVESACEALEHQKAIVQLDEIIDILAQNLGHSPIVNTLLRSIEFQRALIFQAFRVQQAIAPQIKESRINKRIHDTFHLEREPRNYSNKMNKSYQTSTESLAQRSDHDVTNDFKDLEDHSHE